MAFCEKCGKEIGPSGKCDCQESQAQGASAGQAASYYGQAAAGQTASSQGQASAPKKKNTTAIIAAAAAAVVVVLLVIIFAVAGGGSYKTPIKDLAKLINKQSTDIFAYQETMADPITADYTRAAYKILKKNEDVKEELEDSEEDIKDLFDDIKGFKITKCDFSSADKMEGKALRAIEDALSANCEEALEMFEDMDDGDYEDLADELEISKSDAKNFVKKTQKALKEMSKVDVKAGYEVTVRFYGKYDGEEDKTEKIEVRVVKVDGTWYIYDANKLFRGLAFSDELSDINSDLRSLYNYINASSQIGDIGF